MRNLFINRTRKIYMQTIKDLQNNKSDTYSIAYKIKINYFMTKQTWYQTVEKIIF